MLLKSSDVGDVESNVVPVSIYSALETDSLFSKTELSDEIDVGDSSGYN